MIEFPRKIGTDESGFTLVEVLVATMMMLMVVFALYALFDMSVRVYGIGNSEVETNEQARVALERMEREIRNATCETTCLESGSETEIKLDTQTETASQNVHYRVVNGELLRNSETLARVGNPTPSSSALSLRYCDENYTCGSIFNANPTMVEITLTTERNGRTQKLNTIAGLRNR